MSDPNWVDVGTFCLASAGAPFALWQYYKAQRWKQLEFVAEQVKQFDSDPQVNNAMLMLDWKVRTIDLYPKLNDPESRFVTVDDSMLYKALATRQEDTKTNFTDEEAEIRACFDSFFSYLQRFDQFIEARLVRRMDFWPFLRYWLNFIGDPEEWKRSDGKEAILMWQLWDFVDYYEYSGVTRLFKRYGISIQLTKEEVDQLKANLTLPVPQ
jgi:hypothetical protein